MNVRGIIQQYLKDNGYDGLFYPGECACKVDDLIPCNADCYMDCEPGYVTPCNCGDHDFHIGPKQLKTSEQWQEVCTVEVLDPDGWDRRPGNFDYSWRQEMITREEFERRLGSSTCRWPHDAFQPGSNIWKDKMQCPQANLAETPVEISNFDSSECELFEEIKP